jgi:hypothetical protein
MLQWKQQVQGKSISRRLRLSFKNKHRKNRDPVVPFFHNTKMRKRFKKIK